MTTDTRRIPSKLEIERELIMRRSAIDPWYWMTNYLYVKVVGKGYQLMEPYDHVREIVEWMMTKHHGKPTRSGALKARQITWTTTTNGFALWSALFHDNHEWLQVSVGEDEAQKALEEKFYTPYLNLPKWMRDRLPNPTTVTQREVVFDNGSGMTAIPSTSRSGRSRAMFGCIFDEAAFMVDASEVFAAIEPMIYGPIFMFSTANGMGNFFHSIWTESLADDTLWDMLFFPWHVMPDRDDDWYKRKELTYRQQKHLFYQEYPASPAEAFMRSGRTAYDIAELEDTQCWCPPAMRLDLNEMLTHRHLDEMSQIELSMIPQGQSRDLELHVWELPDVLRDDHGRVLQQPNYTIGVDVAEGLAHGDFSAIDIRDVNANTQVATVRAHVPIYELGEIVEMLGYWYCTALVGVERNSFGLVPLEYLRNNAYPRLYRMDSIAEMKRGQRTPRYGWLTTRTTKPKMVQDMAKELASDGIVLHDRRWLQEATTFVSTGTGRYEATPGNTDDLMMASLITQQMALDVGRFPIVWHDEAPGPLTFADVFDTPAYAGRKVTDAAVLDSPIGQPYRDPVHSSFTIEQR